MAERTFAETLARIVRKRLRALLDDADGALARGNDAELHALRIDVKRLRYTLECAIPLARDETLGALDLLARMQERLGELADVDTFGRTYERLAESLLAGDPRRVGLNALTSSAGRERERALAAARALWGEGASPYPERLATSVSAALASLSPKSP